MSWDGCPPMPAHPTRGMEGWGPKAPISLDTSSSERLRCVVPRSREAFARSREAASKKNGSDWGQFPFRSRPVFRPLRGESCVMRGQGLKMGNSWLSIDLDLHGI